MKKLLVREKIQVWEKNESVENYGGLKEKCLSEKIQVESEKNAIPWKKHEFEKI